MLFFDDLLNVRIRRRVPVAVKGRQALIELLMHAAQLFFLIRSTLLLSFCTDSIGVSVSVVLLDFICMLFFMRNDLVMP